jgi:hypothetical protein
LISEVDFYEILNSTKEFVGFFVGVGHLQVIHSFSPCKPLAKIEEVGENGR